MTTLRRILATTVMALVAAILATVPAPAEAQSSDAADITLSASVISAINVQKNQDLLFPDGFAGDGLTGYSQRGRWDVFFEAGNTLILNVTAPSHLVSSSSDSLQVQYGTSPVITDNCGGSTKTFALSTDATCQDSQGDGDLLVTLGHANGGGTVEVDYVAGAAVGTYTGLATLTAQYQ